VITPLVLGKRILVCVGPGGVGKTTTSAAVGALAARQGRRTLVCTIDPAPRLADALGIGGLGPDPRPVPAAACRALGIDAGAGDRFFAVRLDTERTFARLVDEQVADSAMKRRIFDNTIYRQITTTLTGSAEYAAMLALHGFATGGQFDLVVLDTPPTANALDFLDAPRRLAAAVSSPAIRWFARPAEDETGTKGLKRFSLQRLRSGSALVLRRMAKLVGNRFLEDVSAFLVDFQAVLGGFLSRAQAIERLLRDADAAFLLVLVPEVAAVDEALFLHARLAEAKIPMGGFIANRVQPSPGLTEAAAIVAALRAQPAFAGLPDDTIAEAAERLAPVSKAFGALFASERRELARLMARAPGVAVTEIPLLDHDVDNLAELRVVGDHLLSASPSPP
jgi:anion-transporting  ArsA/GET3 family ATPase